MKPSEEKAEEALQEAEQAIENVWFYGAIWALIKANRHTLAALKKHKQNYAVRRSE